MRMGIIRRRRSIRSIGAAGAQAAAPVVVTRTRTVLDVNAEFLGSLLYMTDELYMRLGSFLFLANNE